MCPECRDREIESDSPATFGNRHASYDQRLFFTWALFVTAFLSVTSGLTLMIGGVRGGTIVAVIGQVGLAVALVWPASTPTGQQHVRLFWQLVGQLALWGSHLLRRYAEQIRQAAEDYRHSLREKRRQKELIAEQQRVEFERARRPRKTVWPSTKSVDARQAITYGIGSQYVYGYTFPTALEVARLKAEGQYNIKVGMASNDPVQRVHDQISASKTAISEPAVLLLVFQTHDCRQLEKWLHSQLEKDADSIGREWFTTSPDELISLFHAYLDQYFVSPQKSDGSEGKE